MKIKSFLFIAALFMSSTLLGQSSKYTITGKVEGFDDQTLLYLCDLSDGSYVKIDSAFIINGEFKFIGQLDNGFQFSSICTPDFSNRVRFWLEKGTTTFFATKGKFSESTIKGTAIQDKYNELQTLHLSNNDSPQIDFDFIKQNPKSFLAAYVLSSNLRTWNKDTISTLYNFLSNEFKLSRYGEVIANHLLFYGNVQIGDKFVEFSQADTTGNMVTLSKIKSKYILLDFWGSWCGPCIEQIPSLLTVYEEFKPKGFEIIGIAAETNKEKWVNAIRKFQINWINVTDFKGDQNMVALMYGVNAYPTNYLIDRNGIIIAKDIESEELRELLMKEL